MGNIDFTPALSVGLRPERLQPINSQNLTLCTNMRPTEFGLKPFYTISQPITSAELTALGITKAWPYPQLFRGKKYTMLFAQNNVFEVAETPTGDWQLTAITTKDAADLAAAVPGNKSITGNAPWHYMDFYDTRMAFNGTSVVFKTGHSSNWFTTDAVTITTGAEYREARAFYAGFNSANMYALANWPGFIDDYEANFPAEVAALTTAGTANTQWVWWSKIGGGDLMWLFTLLIGKFGSLEASPTTQYSTAHYAFQDMAKLNQSGLRPMPWPGTVTHMRTLGDRMIVYGTGGASVLSPEYVEPISTFGLSKLVGWGSNLGIASRSAVGGNEDVHCILDQTGDLWIAMMKDGAVVAERLGRQEFLEGMVSSTVVISYESKRKEFYVSDGTSCYILSESGGVAKAPQMPTTVYFAESHPIGIVTNTVSPIIVEAQSEAFSGSNVPGEIWSVRSIKLRTTDIDATGWRVYLQYRFKNTKTWTESAAGIPDATGETIFNYPGAEFRWRLTHPDRASTELEGLTVEMVQGAKTNLRHWFDASTPAAATV